MSSPSSGSDPNYPQWGAPQNQPSWGGAQQPGYPPAYAGGAGAPSMGFRDAVLSVLTQYAVFSGRARRAEYWWFALFSLIASVVASVIDQGFGAPVVSLVVALGLLVPSIAVSVRRLHDTDRSGWWLLLGLVPFGGIVVLVFLCLDGQPGTNRFGPSPKYPAAAAY